MFWAQKEMPSSGPIGVALVAPDKAKHFYLDGLRLVRLTYFTQMGLAGPDKAEYADGPVSQEEFEAATALPLPGVEG